MMDMRKLTAAAAVVITLALLGGCEPMGNECPEGTVQSDSDTQVVCQPVSDDMRATSAEDSGAARADAERDREFTECVEAGGTGTSCGRP